MPQQLPWVSTIGRTLGHYRPRPFGIRQNDRLLHMYIIGQTGTGKSTLMLNLMAQDLEHGQGFCLIDPHGDLARTIGSISAPNVIYWDVADPDCPFGYNPLTRVSASYRPLLASGLIDTLKKQWIDAWGARMEHLLRFALLALLEHGQSDLRDIVPLFLDKSFRKEVLSRITDPSVQAFWTQEYPAMNYKGAVDGVAPIANKLGAFLAHPVVRKAICEPKAPLRLRSIMDDGQVLIVNLAKGRLGADVSNVLGGLLSASLANAAYSRQDQSESDRRPFYFYADEFHAFTTSAFAGMLSELRKYGLGLILAHQHTEQIERSVLVAVLGNVGTMIAFRLGATDAPIIAHQLGEVQPGDLTGLANYEMIIKMMIDGAQTKPFSAISLSNFWTSDRW